MLQIISTVLEERQELEMRGKVKIEEKFFHVFVNYVGKATNLVAPENEDLATMIETKYSQGLDKVFSHKRSFRKNLKRYAKKQSQPVDTKVDDKLE